MRRLWLASGLVLVLGLGLSCIETAAAEEAQGEAIPPPMPVPVMPVPEEYRPAGPAPGPTVQAAPVLPVPFGPSPSPADGFEGLGDNICSTVAGGCTIPPDTHGAVGLDDLGQVRFMEVLNTEVHIQDDTGGVVWGPTGIDAFWGAAVNPNLDGVFDPRVHYDPDGGGHWISVACDENYSVNPDQSSVLIGVSVTSDPTGAWYRQRFDVDPTNVVWADYPNVGFNGKWVVVQVNLFTVASPTFDSSQIWVFDKSQLYGGNFTPAGDFRVTGQGGTQVPATTHDPLEPNLYLLQRWNGNSSGLGYLRLYRITGPAGAPVLEWFNPDPPRYVVSPDPWEGSAPGSPAVDFAPQTQDPAPSNCANCASPPCKIQTNDDRIQNLVMRNGTLWASQTIFLPAGGAPTRSSVQWWQIATDTTVLQRGRVDDSTGARFFGFPSIAVNKHDDVLLGYSSFTSPEYASASYSFRYSFDSPDTMRDEHVFRSGDACYYKNFSAPSRNRWGDFSATVVAPDDTRLWTLQEYAAPLDLSEPIDSFRDKWGTYWSGLAPDRTIVVSDVSAFEGDTGTTSFTFTVELKDPTGTEYAPSPAGALVQWNTADGTATVGDADYVAGGGSVTFPAALPGPYPNPSVQQTFTVDVNGDFNWEGDETFFVDLTNPINAVIGDNQALGVILNDDPQISISDVQEIEGDGGSEATDFIFTVNLSSASPTPVSADWMTVDDTAVAGAIGTGDFTFVSGTVNFAPGVLTQNVVVKVHGDLIPEPPPGPPPPDHETFFVDLTGATGGSILKSRGVGTIVDDDWTEPGVEALTIVSDSVGPLPTDGRNRLQWLTPPGATGANEFLIKFNRSAAAGGTCTPPDPNDPNTPLFSGQMTPSPVLPDTKQGFLHSSLDLDYEYCYTVWIHYGVGGPYSLPGATQKARPYDSTTSRVKWKVYAGMSALAQPTVGFDAVVAPMNDSYLNAMTRGASGGPWPAAWKPRKLSHISQQRNPIVPLGGKWRMFVATQDGRVHSVDTTDGTLYWSTQLPEGAAVGAPAGIFTAFGGAYDYILVGTSSGAGDRLYALDPFTGAVIDAFPQAVDGVVGTVGAINGMPTVDYANRRVYFGSWQGTSNGTLWCLDLGPSSDALSLNWKYDGQQVNGSPVLHNGRVYVGNTNGEVESHDAANGDTDFYVRDLGDGEPKGFLFPDRRYDDLYVATNNNVWAITDTGSALDNTTKWGGPTPLVDPSVVLHHPGTDDIYVGVRDYGGTAAVVKLDAASGNYVSHVSLESGPVTIGPPSLDLGPPGMLHMGSVAGILYAVELGF